jgi:type IV pilus assembly protein PilB
MSSQLQPSLVGLSGMARRLVSEGMLPEADVRKAMADSVQNKAPSLPGYSITISSRAFS